jgi:hypothetical protein
MAPSTQTSSQNLFYFSGTLLAQVQHRQPKWYLTDQCATLYRPTADLLHLNGS